MSGQMLAEVGLYESEQVRALPVVVVEVLWKAEAVVDDPGMVLQRGHQFGYGLAKLLVCHV